MTMTISDGARDGALLLIWSKHRDVLPSFDRYLAQREHMGAWRCPGCGELFSAQDDWRAKTDLVEVFTLIKGGRSWECRRCRRCNSVRSLPVRGG